MLFSHKSLRVTAKAVWQKFYAQVAAVRSKAQPRELHERVAEQPCRESHAQVAANDCKSRVVRVLRTSRCNLQQSRAERVSHKGFASRNNAVPLVSRTSRGDLQQKLCNKRFTHKLQRVAEKLQHISTSRCKLQQEPCGKIFTRKSLLIAAKPVRRTSRKVFASLPSCGKAMP